MSTISRRNVSVELQLAQPTDAGETLKALIAAWLGQYAESEDTRRAYLKDLEQYLYWCARRDLNVLAVTLPKFQMFVTELHHTGSPYTGRPYSAASIARKIGAVSSFYGFLARAGAVAANPARDAKRPRTSGKDSPTSHVGQVQAKNMVSVAVDTPHRTLTPLAAGLSIAILLSLGLRVSELCRLNIEDLDYRDGIRVIRVRMKGRKERMRPVPASLAGLLDKHLAERGSPEAGPLVSKKDGSRIDRLQMNRLVPQTAKRAGVPHWKKITPHSCRHAYNTIARELGVPLEDRQHSLGHSSPVTTQIYDHVAQNVRNDPAHTVADFLF